MMAPGTAEMACKREGSPSLATVLHSGPEQTKLLTQLPFHAHSQAAGSALGSQGPTRSHAWVGPAPGRRSRGGRAAGPQGAGRV